MRFLVFILTPLILLASPALGETLSERLAALGEEALTQDNSAAAIDYCEQAIVSDPANAQGFACLARSYAAKEDKTLTAKYYLAAHAILPYDQSLLVAAIKAEADAGKDDSVQTMLDKLAALCNQCDVWQEAKQFVSTVEEARKAEALENALSKSEAAETEAETTP